MQATKKGIGRYEVITSQGDVETIETKALYIPNLGCRLFSPQAYFREQQNPEYNCSFDYKKLKINLGDRKTILTQFEDGTYLPVIPAFESALKTANMLACSGWVTDEENQNLSKLQKWLLSPWSNGAFQQLGSGLEPVAQGCLGRESA